MKVYHITIILLLLSFTSFAQRGADTIPATRMYLLDSSVVTANRIESSRGNSFLYSPSVAFNTISIVGEPDVIRHISSLPGVSQGIEGTLGLFVRGANNGGNKTIFNGVPMHSSSHLLGLVSTFAPESIEEASFMMGGIDAKYGNLSSSIIDIQTKDPLKTPQGGKLTLSPYLTGFSYTFHPGRKWGIQLSARTSFIPQLTSLFFKLSKTYLSFNGWLSDVSAIATYSPNEKNTFDIMAYRSDDHYTFSSSTEGWETYNVEDSEYKEEWSTTALKTGWKHSFSPDLTIYSKAYFSLFHSGQTNNRKNLSFLKLSSVVNEFALSSTLDWNLNNNNSLTFDASFSNYLYRPANQASSTSTTIDKQSERALPASLLALSADWKFSSERIDLLLGVRPSLLFSGGDILLDCDIRAKMDFAMTNSLGLELTADRMVQYNHTLEGLPVGWYEDIIVPASKAFPQEITHQLYSGLFFKKEYKKMSLQITLGGYYRKMNNIVSYIYPPAIFFSMPDNTWESQVDVGKGSSYGAEFSAAVSSARLNASLAYTLSKTDRKFPNINNGAPFPFKFDRTHILNTEAKYLLIHRQKGTNTREHFINVAFVFSSGNMETITEKTYEGVLPPLWERRSESYNDLVQQNAVGRQKMSSKNGYRMKDYLRLDIAYTIAFHRPKTDHELSFSVYNVTNRHNPYLIYYSEGVWRQVSIMPILPCIRWTMEF